MPAIRNRPARLLALLVIFLLLAASAPLLPGEGAASPRDRASWSFSSTGLPTTGNYYGVTFADINKDGKIDVVAAPDGAGIKVYKGDGAGCWTALTPQPQATGGSDVRVGDIDNDGNPDIVSGSSSSANGIHIYKGNGAGAFSEITSGSGLPTSGNWRGIALGDVDKDGNIDIAATNGYSGTLGIRVYTGDGTGKFTNDSAGLPTSGERYSGVVLVDFNNDGNLDLAAGGAAGANCFLGNGGSGGAMSWTDASTGLPTNTFTGVNATDADNDGIMDIVLGSYSNVGVRVYRNVNNASSWTSMSTGLPTRGYFIDVSSGDFDSDGNSDLVFGNYSGPGIKVYYGNGAGSWSENSTGLCATDSYVGNEVGDFNCDGSPDLVIASYSNKGILAFKNMHSAPPSPVLNLTAPLGDVSWSGGSQHLISWNATNGTLPYNLTLSYSTDSGGNYSNNIAPGLPQTLPGPNSWAWDLPMIDSTGVRVRVGLKDLLNQTISRASPYDFEIDSTSPAVVSTMPSDGAQGMTNSTQVRIRFSENMNRSSVEGAVSISGPGAPALRVPTWSGTELVLPSSGLSQDARYSVTVSAAAKDDSDPGNPLAAPYTFTFNTSNAQAPAIALDSPAGGEVWVAGSQHEIGWTASGGTGLLTINLSCSTMGPGGPWTLLAAGEPNDGSYNWTVPAVPSSNCFVRATVTDSGTPRKNASDVNAAPFTIKQAAVPLHIDLTAPKGGEVWITGSRQNITWNASGGNGIRSIALQHSRNGPAGPWTDIAANEADDGLFSWTVPDTPSTSCLVKVTVRDSYDPPQNASASNPAAFIIKEAAAPLSVVLASPNGGENWTVGSRHDVAWSATGGDGARSVLLQCSLSGGAGPWADIADNETDDGVYTWTAPNTTSTSCLIRVTVKDSNDPPQSASDQSDAAFTVSRTVPPDTQPPSVHIDFPAEGASVNGTVTIRASATDNIGVVRVELSIDGMNVAGFTSSPCAFDWLTTKRINGRHTITVRAWDPSGNIGSASVNITVKFPAVEPTVKRSTFLDGYGWILAAAVAIAAVAMVLAVLLRRKPPGPAPQGHAHGAGFLPSASSDLR